MFSKENVGRYCQSAPSCNPVFSDRRCRAQRAPSLSDNVVESKSSIVLQTMTRLRIEF